jgi:hypothetical protein
MIRRFYDGTEGDRSEQLFGVHPISSAQPSRSIQRSLRVSSARSFGSLRKRASVSSACPTQNPLPMSMSTSREIPSAPNAALEKLVAIEKK